VTITRKINVSLATYAALEKIAESIGDPANVGAAVAKLVANSQSCAPTEKAPPQTEHKECVPVWPGQAWRSPSGHWFPVGLQLRAQYRGKTYAANVTINGIDFEDKTYDSPSTAAIAVTESAGMSGLSANPDGWAFWEMLNQETGQWVSIVGLRAGKK
jgi:hypothetical protein